MKRDNVYKIDLQKKTTNKKDLPPPAVFVEIHLFVAAVWLQYL